MNAAMLRNMTLEELTQYVDQCDSVPREAVQVIMKALQDEIDSADYARREEETERLNAVDAIRQLIDKPPKTKELIFEALDEWVTEWEGALE